ncbi:MAG: 50S ribosome-binding GTPase [Candidatus Eremiobacteraeota bacterium]|nr:50S ribosome-binding GTPase [Candidatus Eremiobacteraeota bacterium]
MRAVFDLAKLVDVVLEVRDARIPEATAVVELHKALKQKPRIVLLNKADLASPAATRRWVTSLGRRGVRALSGIGTRAESLRPLRAALLSAERKRVRVRIAVVGAPNTGKSSVINALLRRKRAVAENRPGITRHVKWLALDKSAELLDTPGVLQPRIDPRVAWKLALCSVVPERAFDVEDVVAHFVAWLSVQPDGRGMRGVVGERDAFPDAARILKAFRSGKLGRMSLEDPALDDA